MPPKWIWLSKESCLASSSHKQKSHLISLCPTELKWRVGQGLGRMLLQRPTHFIVPAVVWVHLVQNNYSSIFNKDIKFSRASCYWVEVPFHFFWIWVTHWAIEGFSGNRYSLPGDPISPRPEWHHFLEPMGFKFESFDGIHGAVIPWRGLAYNEHLGVKKQYQDI